METAGVDGDLPGPVQACVCVCVYIYIYIYIVCSVTVCVYCSPGKAWHGDGRRRR